MVHFSLANIPDKATREHLQAIPTGLDISASDAQLLIDAGERQVRDSADLSLFKASLTLTNHEQGLIR
jgi:hypothetical protein